MRISDWSSDVCSSDLDVTENLCAKGGYRLRDASAARKVVLVATGSEVSLAMEVADKLEAAGHGADVVSMVSTELFDEQSATYQADILPDDALIVSIEAGTTFGWERYRSEEHTSELQSLMRTSYAVFCLKKKNNNQ